MIRVLNIICFCLLASVIANAQLPEMAVWGIKLGDSLDHARAAIGSNFKFSNELPRVPAQGDLQTYFNQNLRILIATKGENEAYLLEALDDKVVYIQHHIEFPEGKQPLLSQMKERVLAQFGPVKIGAFGDGGTWIWDLSGKLIDEHTLMEVGSPYAHCSPAVTPIAWPSGRGQLQNTYEANLKITATQTFGEVCSYTVAVHLPPYDVQGTRPAFYDIQIQDDHALGMWEKVKQKK